MSESDPKRCESSRADGSPCRAPVLPGRPHCYSHDPQVAEERLEARRRGGRHSAKVHRLRPLLPPRLAPIFATIESALEETRDGAITPAQAQALASLARAAVSVLQAGELEERVRSLEGDAREAS